MNDLTDILDKNNIPDNIKYYWKYQYRLGKEIIVPYLIKKDCFKKGFTVAEIGCAEGGVVTAFEQEGAGKCIGTDIAKIRLDDAKKMANLFNINIEYFYNDILKEELKPDYKNFFDLVILRDVIEHIDDTALVLKNIKKILKPNGSLYVTFPPYYSAFGGHQHTLNNFIGKFPFIHLLPKSLFFFLISSGRQNDIMEVKRLKNIKLTPEKFIDIAHKEGFYINSYDYYLIRPVYKMKFGISSIKLTGLASWKFIRNYFSMEASFILKIK
jgi:SAM-dependent methyltransferase